MSAATPPDEARRQQQLLAVLRGEAPPQAVSAWLRDDPARAQRGLQAYAANAGALAERALSAAFPTVSDLVGAPAFAALARALWQAHPPLRGDVAQWGDTLPGFIATDPQLAGEPYLADVAALDWAVHRAELAGEASNAVTNAATSTADNTAATAAATAATGLGLLASGDPDGLWLHLAPGTALLTSPHPVATIWRAHRSTAADRFAPVRQAFAQGTGEHALVWRQGYKAQVSTLPETAAGFTRSVLAGVSLGLALDGAGPDFSFEAWLLAALQQGWLAAVDTVGLDPQEPPHAPQT